MPGQSFHRTFSLHLIKIHTMHRRYLNHLSIAALLSIILGNASFLHSQVNWTESIDVAAASFGNSRPRITSDAGRDPLIIWGKSTDVMFSRWEDSGFTMPVK